MIRVAVIGAGGMGACHAAHLRDCADATPVWIADPDEVAGRRVAGETGAAWTADGVQAIADCDAVVIAAPDHFHAEYLNAALDRGLPVLCEKPMTVELADAEAVVAKEVGLGRRLIQLGFMRVYDERHRQVEAALSGLGRAVHVRCVHRNVGASRRTVAEILVQSIIHDIHTIRWLAGTEIVEVFTTTAPASTTPRIVALHCRLANDSLATVEFDGDAAGYEVSVEVSAEHGNVVSAEPARAVVRRQGSISTSIGADWFAPFLDTYRVELRAWLDAIAKGETTGPSAWDGYAAQAVVEAAVASHASRLPAPVQLNPVPALYGGTSS